MTIATLNEVKSSPFRRAGRGALNARGHWFKAKAQRMSIWTIITTNDPSRHMVPLTLESDSKANESLSVFGSPLLWAAFPLTPSLHGVKALPAHGG